jgi:hypothetical protein
MMATVAAGILLQLFSLLMWFGNERCCRFEAIMFSGRYIYSTMGEPLIDSSLINQNPVAQGWRLRRESNSQPAVLETAALSVMELKRDICGLHVEAWITGLSRRALLIEKLPGQSPAEFTISQNSRNRKFWPYSAQ